MGRKLRKRLNSKQSEARVSKVRTAPKFPMGRETHWGGHLAGGTLMTPTIEAIGTRVYLCVAVAILLVSPSGSCRRPSYPPGILGDLCTAPVILCAEIHNQEQRGGGSFKHSLCNGGFGWEVWITLGSVALGSQWAPTCWGLLSPHPVASVLAFAKTSIPWLISS